MKRWKKPAYHSPRNRTDATAFAEIEIDFSKSLVGLLYPQAKSIANSLGIFAYDERLWSETSHVRKLLRYFGIKAGSREIPFRSWEALPDLALLSTKWHLEKGRTYWHWVVFVRENRQSYVLDSNKSLRTNRRTDFGRLKPKCIYRSKMPNIFQ